MKKLLCIILLGMLFSFYLIGCNQGVQTAVNSTDKEVTEKHNVLTMEKIKERYTEKDLGKFVKTYDYKNYILIEYINPVGYQCYDLYNLETGDRDQLCLGINAEVFNFSSGDCIVFKSDGTHQQSDRKYFPYYAVLTRAKEITGNETDFSYGKRELFKPIGEGIELSGGKNCEIISDLKVNLTGLEMAFAPQKGKETEFYAGNIDIPVMKTSYDQNKNQFAIELYDTLISQELLNKKFTEQNKNIKSVEVKEKGTNSLIIIGLNDIAKYYSGEVGNFDDSPYVKFIFRDRR